jgi:hypothetical protein
MKLSNLNLPIKQLLVIQESLEAINKTNNDFRSSKKIDGLQLFKDKNNNIYMSYCLHYVNGDGPDSSLEYFMIDSTGNKTNLSLVYQNKSDIALKLSRYDEITIQ